MRKNTKKEKNNKRKLIPALGISVVCLLGMVIFFAIRRNTEQQGTPQIQEVIELEISENQLPAIISDNTSISLDAEKNVFVEDSSASQSNLPDSVSEDSISSNQTLSEDIAQSEIETATDSNLASDEAGENDLLDNGLNAEAQWLENVTAGTVLTAAEVDSSNLKNYFYSYPISDEVFQRINGKSYRENPDISIDDLRYIKVLHYNFSHQIQVGELIVNKDIAEDVTNIFYELYQAEYEIQSMYLIDRYWTGDESDTDIASIEVNNTSAFFYRKVSGSGKLSNHAYGRAIDINPQQNPYVSYKTGSPVWDHENANDYIDRTNGNAHMILQGDICYRIFTKYGFTWGGNWNTIKDYQHFEKK